MSERLTYEEFCGVADRLYYELMEMPTANKTYKTLQHGSLATHQLYLNRWRDERKRKPSTIPEQLESMIVQKAKQLADTTWEVLNKGSDEICRKVKEESEYAIKAAEESVRLAHIERESALSELQQTKLKHETGCHEISALKEELQQSQKLLFAAEEAKTSLQEQIKEIKHNFQQQIEHIKSQHGENVHHLKEQYKQAQEKLLQEIAELKETYRNNEQGYQKQINVLQENLHEMRLEKDKVIKSNIALSAKLEEMQAKNVESQRIIKEINAEKVMLQQNQQRHEIEIVRANTELSQAREQGCSYKKQLGKMQEQLLEYSIKIGGLEEKLVHQKKGKIKKKNLETTTV